MKEKVGEAGSGREIEILSERGCAGAEPQCSLVIAIVPGGMLMAISDHVASELQGAGAQLEVGKYVA